MELAEINWLFDRFGWAPTETGWLLSPRHFTVRAEIGDQIRWEVGDGSLSVPLLPLSLGCPHESLTAGWDLFGLFPVLDQIGVDSRLDTGRELRELTGAEVLASMVRGTGLLWSDHSSFGRVADALDAGEPVPMGDLMGMPGAIRNTLLRLIPSDAAVAKNV